MIIMVGLVNPEKGVESQWRGRDQWKDLPGIPKRELKGVDIVEIIWACSESRKGS